MATRQQQTSSGFTFKQLLIAIIVIGIFTTVGSVALLIQKNASNYPSIEQTIQAVREILLETKNKAAIEGNSYILQFRNHHQGVEYSTQQNNTLSEWEKLSNSTGITVQESKIVFDSKGNLKSPTRQLFFEYKGQKKCLILEPNLNNNIREEEDAKCKELLQTDTFPQAISKAINAANLTQSAKSSGEWKIVVSQWKEAIALMKTVPSSSSNYAVAKQKVREYQRNLNYAKKNSIANK